MRPRTRLLITVPLLLLALFVAVGAIVIPSFVSSRAHRAVIERLASSLSGRDVHVGGKLSLALLPAPRLTAEGITITGPAGETIAARSLSLGIAVGPLLRGALVARSLSLQSATIALPWPLPGGAAAVTAPGLLSARHAVLADSRIAIGGVSFEHVAADIFVQGGLMSVGGTGMFRGRPVDVAVVFQDATPQGGTPVTADVSTPDAALSARLAGTLDGAGNFAGGIAASLRPPGLAPLAGTAGLALGAGQARVTDLAVRQGDALIGGGGTYAFSSGTVAAALTARGLALGPWLAAASKGVAGGPPGLSLRLAVKLVDAAYDGVAVPSASADVAVTPQGLAVTQLVAALAGGTVLKGAATLPAGGGATGTASATTKDLAALAAALGAPGLPPGLGAADASARFTAATERLALPALAGHVDGGGFSGQAVATRGADGLAVAGALHFSRLDLTGLPAALPATLSAALPGGIGLNGEVAVDAARYRGVALQDVLLDGSVAGGRIVLRHASAALLGGVAAGSATLGTDGSLGGQAVASLPRATPLAGLLPPDWAPPAVLTQPPLGLSVAAGGRASALAVSATAGIGPLALTAAPVLDLADGTFGGAVTLRYPSAIAALSAFGVPAGLAWPGAGSFALRAFLQDRPDGLGLPDFVLSFGASTASGSLLRGADGAWRGSIDAGTLALPPWPPQAALPLAALSGLRGTLGIRAAGVLMGGVTLLGASAATLRLAPRAATLELSRAGLFGGDLTGRLGWRTAPKTLPTATLDLALAKADAARLTPVLGGALVPATGTLDAQATLAATGAAPTDWLASVAGTASVTGADGTLPGFDLAAVKRALAAKPPAAASLKAALSQGATAYTSLAATMRVADGKAVLGGAALQGPDGKAAAAGSLDFTAGTQALAVTLQPDVAPPLSLKLWAAGPLGNPKLQPDVAAAAGWTPAPVPPPAPPAPVAAPPRGHA